jgi:hypothetical protein
MLFPPVVIFLFVSTGNFIILYCCPPAIATVFCEFLSESLALLSGI